MKTGDNTTGLIFNRWYTRCIYFGLIVLFAACTIAIQVCAILKIEITRGSITHPKTSRVFDQNPSIEESSKLDYAENDE
jgi:hypothetical protein